MPSARLEMIDALGRRRIVGIDRDPFTLGRSHGNSLPLTSAEISREHANIVRNGEDFLLRDRDSRAGTFVNDQPITEATLAHGDRIRIGRQTELTFLIGDAVQTNEKTTASVGDFQQVAALLEGLRALGSAKVLDHVLALVIDSAIAITDADRGFLMLLTPEGNLEFKLGRGRDRSTLPGNRFETSRKIPEQVFTSGQPRLVADLLDDALADAHQGTVALGIRNVACVPLKLLQYVEAADDVVEDRRIGVLYLDSRVKGSLRSKSTQLALETLAAEAAVAIENARLYRESQEKARLDQELRTAHEFQQALLPKAAPVKSYFEAAAAMVPCRSIGGDFYEYLELEDGAFGFTLGDVAGKGAPAGLLGARVQEIFAAQAAHPSITVARINDVLMRRALQARFVTLLYGVLAPDGQLTYCNAGHNPPLLLGDDGVRRLDKGGTILGLFDDATFEEERVRLRPGDTLIVFSDGISEALNGAGEEFGDVRILDCVSAIPPWTEPRIVIDTLFSRVREFTVGEPQSDDMTTLVVRYRGSPRRQGRTLRATQPRRIAKTGRSGGGTHLGDSTTRLPHAVFTPPQA